MPDLPSRPDLAQLRHQAKDLLRAAQNGEGAASARIRAVSDRLTLTAARLALAREYGFASWAKLKTEVERREILDERDLGPLTTLLAQEPALATATMEHWCDHPMGSSPLGYVAMLRFDTSQGAWRDVAGTGAVARALIEAGALVEGDPEDRETPLITAASYGDAEVARALIEAGADLEATSAPDSGGVPAGSALLHAAVFGMTDVVDVLVASGARVEGIEQAAAAGDVSGWLTAETPLDNRVRALGFAAGHDRVCVIDQLIAAGTPVDGVDPEWGWHALRTAAGNGRAASVRRLLAHGADPNLRDGQGRAPLDLCRQHRPAGTSASAGHDEVEEILAPLTSAAQPDEPGERGSPAGKAGRAKSVPTLTVEIRAGDFPGSRCGPNPEGRMYENVHVGLSHRADTVELVRGDAQSARWQVEVTVGRDEEGRPDLGGPFVHGRRGERSLGLRWGTLAWDDSFEVFRAAKLRFSDVDPALVEHALGAGSRLVASLGLTDQQGYPVCASVRPPDVAWSIED